MTAPALAELVLRYECPVVPARVERIKGARLRLTVEPPLQFTPSGDRHADVKAIMTLVNEKLEPGPARYQGRGTQTTRLDNARRQSHP